MRTPPHEARAARDGATLDTRAVEVDGLAADVVRYARTGEADARALSAATVAIDTARATLADLRQRIAAA